MPTVECLRWVGPGSSGRGHAFKPHGLRSSAVGHLRTLAYAFMRTFERRLRPDNGPTMSMPESGKNGAVCCQVNWGPRRDRSVAEYAGIGRV
jgi:hypothetical protein